MIQFALRDYIQYWYYTLSEDESFLLEIRQTLQNALVQFSTRYASHIHTHTRSAATSLGTTAKQTLCKMNRLNQMSMLSLSRAPVGLTPRFSLVLSRLIRQGPKKWTGSLTSPLAWWTTLPPICVSFVKLRIVSQTKRTNKVSADALALVTSHHRPRDPLTNLSPVCCMAVNDKDKSTCGSLDGFVCSEPDRGQHNRGADGLVFRGRSGDGEEDLSRRSLHFPEGRRR